MFAVLRNFSSRNLYPITNKMRNFRLASKRSKHICTVIVLVIFFTLIFHFWYVTNLAHEKCMKELNKMLKMDTEETYEFVVRDEVCDIPKINPYTPELLENLSLKITCPAQLRHLSSPLVTKLIDNSTGQYVLKIDTDAKYHYLGGNANITCCFRVMHTLDGAESANAKASLSPCHTLQQDFVVPPEVNGMIVNCWRLGSKKIIFMDAFFFIQQRQYAKRDGKKVGVLIFGIDSLSQINFRRRMPHAYNYLRNNKDIWFEMLGFNKLGYDTFPNLMAVLTGYNLAKTHKDCNPQQKGKLDTCPFLWKQAKAFGRPTAYAEDRTDDTHTLTTNKAGFLEPPTDYYLPPYMVAAHQQLSLSADFKMSKYCLGSRLKANHVLSYALEFALQLRGHGGLGVFWMSSFCDNYEEPTIFQHNLYKYLDTLKMFNLFENYVVILMSGNGMLHGRLNQMKSGFYEERLPILYISIPQAWKRHHPEYETILNLNRKRLISPLDLHQTVKEVLALDASGTPKLEVVPSTDGPECRSLLRPIFTERTCSDVGIDWMWCSCEPYQSIMTNSKTVALLMNTLMAHMNQHLQLAGLLNGTCFTLSLHTIYAVYQSQHSSGYYRVKFKTLMRAAEFELALWYTNEKLPVYIDEKKFKRLDDDAVGCIKRDDEFLQKLCVCVESTGESW